MKTIAKLILFVVLVALPIAGYYLWSRHGAYQKPTIHEIDERSIVVSVPEYQSYTDSPQPKDGRVVFDLAHGNNLLVDDLTPLKDRLSARGVKSEVYDGYNDPLDVYLRGATALAVFVPTYEFSSEERQAIVAFVKDGGRLLLVADPTRAVAYYSDYVDLYSVLFPQSAVPAINSLANAFGVSFFEDYLYNLMDYNANYRNVRYSTFDPTAPLVNGLEQVVLFAAHSVRGNGVALITGDANTYSNVLTRQTPLTPALLAAGGQVLALGDISLFTAPYNRVADNDHFLSNIADWLGSDSRKWDLVDFPYLFRNSVDLIQTFAEAIDPRLIQASSPLQAIFKQAGITLALRTTADPKHDALYVGTFDQLEDVEDFLTRAGVTITMTAEAETAETATKEAMKEDGETEIPKDTIAVDGLGVFVAQGSSLFIVDRSQGKVSLVVLAENEDGLVIALERLVYDDFSGCVDLDDIMVCSTGELPTEVDGGGGGGGGTACTTGGGEVFVLALDTAAKGVRTSAAEWETFLTDYYYTYTIWSVAECGVPTSDDLYGYDVYIVDTGDYAYDENMDETLYAVLGVESGSMLFIGEQPIFIGEDATLEPIYDLQVADATHYLALGFAQDETITLLKSESGVPAWTTTEEDIQPDESTHIVFVRGPTSPASGSPVLIGSEDPDTGQRFILAMFAFYRLPEEYRGTFALNLVSWLMGSGDGAVGATAIPAFVDTVPTP